MERKRPEDRSTTWKPRRGARLYLDDIERIIAIVKDVSDAVSAETADFKGIETSDQLREVPGPRLTGMVISGRVDGGTRISVSLSDGSSSIAKRPNNRILVRIASEDDNELLGALQRLKTVFSDRARPFGAWPHPGPPDHTLWVVFAMVAWPAILILLIRPVAWMLVTLGGVALAFVAWTLFGRNPVPRGVVINASVAEAPTWWNRNRAAVLISLATNSVVALAFFLIGRALA